MNTGGIEITSDGAKFATDAANGGMKKYRSQLALPKTRNVQIKDFAVHASVSVA